MLGDLQLVCMLLFMLLFIVTLYTQKCGIGKYMVVSKMILVSWSVIWVIESDVFLYNIDEYQSDIHMFVHCKNNFNFQPTR